eukprot:TRINITY_DN4257_c0_g3_i1.p1 TRINITY_DN4257_c0_g3~~TRINITY_DN4257_c0_g3_i1.p1  ORF type:complete len:481 (+),score=73.97 TRINITY_DN4257_c0_g3_i1:65-1444(+)
MPPQVTLSRREVARRKMVAFYARCFPGKLPQIDSILDRYPGKEDDVIRTFQLKYPEWNWAHLPEDMTAEALVRVRTTAEAEQGTPEPRKRYPSPTAARRPSETPPLPATTTRALQAEPAQQGPQPQVWAATGRDGAAPSAGVPCAAPPPSSIPPTAPPTPLPPAPMSPRTPPLSPTALPLRFPGFPAPPGHPAAQLLGAPPPAPGCLPSVSPPLPQAGAAALQPAARPPPRRGPASPRSPQPAGLEAMSRREVIVSPTRRVSPSRLSCSPEAAGAPASPSSRRLADLGARLERAAAAIRQRGDVAGPTVAQLAQLAADAAALLQNRAERGMSPSAPAATPPPPPPPPAPAPPPALPRTRLTPVRVRSPTAQQRPLQGPLPRHMVTPLTPNLQQLRPSFEAAPVREDKPKDRDRDGGTRGQPAYSVEDVAAELAKLRDELAAQEAAILAHGGGRATPTNA